MTDSEQTIADFLRTAYTDEKLAALLAHAEDGKLAFNSCCCVAGFPYARHAYQSKWTGDHGGKNYKGFPEGQIVSLAFNRLANNHDGHYLSQSSAEDDAVRRANLIPLVHAEMRRRENEQVSVELE